MTTLFLMSLHPNVQRRAQLKRERVVGKDRLPTIDDQKDLPYTIAVVKEVLRWAPVAPLGTCLAFLYFTLVLIVMLALVGLPHRVTRDDEYHSFGIAKGTTVIANIW
jgi:hypothetical protein